MREIIVDPNTGRWYTVGDNGAEFVNIPDGAIVFNHRQSDALLENGKVAGRGKAMASGSAYVTGFIPVGIGSGRGGGGGGYSSWDDDEDYWDDDDWDDWDDSSELKKIDWIETVINRVERSISRLASIASSSFKNLTSKISAANKEISEIYNEISIQQSAQQRYLAEAESIELDGWLKELVRNGTIDIDEYDEETQDLISQYKEWYEKSLDCADAVNELHESLASLYRDNFDFVEQDADNQLSLIESVASQYNKQMDLLTEKGYILGAAAFDSLIDSERNKSKVLTKELSSLQSSFNAAIDSGEIQKNSEAYYEMLIAINDVKDALADSTIAIQKYNNEIRNIQWEYFDYAQNRISALSSETQFMIDLISKSQIFTDSGKMNDLGNAVLGLYTQDYDIYMAQADAYAKEIMRLNEDLVKDPYNTKLIERRETLLELQRKSILAAEDEKKSISDLVKNGIDKELESMKKMIDSYNDSLDAAKSASEYNKNIKKQAQGVDSLRKQLSAYSGDTSEESFAKIQKLQLDLQNAEEQLQETEYNQYVSEQKKLLDNMYSEYESILNSRLDNIDSLVADVIDSVNSKSELISLTIEKAANSVGYSISDQMKESWGANSVSMYSPSLSDGGTDVSRVLNNIFYYVQAMSDRNNVLSGITQFATGGLANYTGLAKIDGSPSKPELVLNSDDTENLLKAVRSLHNMQGALYRNDFSNYPMLDGYMSRNVDVGGINVNVMLDHVDDYNDFVYKIQHDPSFEKIIQAMTVDKLSGGSPLAKFSFHR